MHKKLDQISDKLIFLAKKVVGRASVASEEFGVRSKDFVKTASSYTKNIYEDAWQKTESIAQQGSIATRRYADQGYQTTKELAQKSWNSTCELYDLTSNYASVKSGAIFAFIAQKDLLDWTDSITKQFSIKASVYDKAMDAEYLRSHIGGGFHRFFDHSHDPINAWEKVKEALPDDSFAEEVLGYIIALWKDAATKMGLPFTTLDQESFNVWADKIVSSVPFVNKSYLYDLLSFDAMEIVSVGIGAVSVFFCLNSQDKKRLSEIIASMGVVSIASANPIMAVFVIGISAYAYTVKKTKLEPSAFLKSASVSIVSCALFTILSMNIFLELLIVIIVSSLFKNLIVNNDMIYEIIINNSRIAIEKGNNLALDVYEQISKISTQTQVWFITR